MNQVEQWFSILERKRLTAPNFADLAALTLRNAYLHSSRNGKRSLIHSGDVPLTVEFGWRCTCDYAALVEPSTHLGSSWTS
jgi:hypothetical protein